MSLMISLILQRTNDRKVILMLITHWTGSTPYQYKGSITYVCEEDLRWFLETDCKFSEQIYFLILMKFFYSWFVIKSSLKDHKRLFSITKFWLDLDSSPILSSKHSWISPGMGTANYISLVLELQLKLQPVQKNFLTINKNLDQTLTLLFQVFGLYF